VRTNAETAVALASHYLDVDQPQRALDVLDGIDGPDLDDAYLWALRTQALVDLKQFAQAAATARNGLSVDAESITLLDLLAIAEAELGELEAAETAILQALELEPEHPVLLCRYALLLARGGELGKATRVCAEAERIDPDDEAVIRCRIALAYVRGDNKAAARESRRLLAELDPDDPVGHTMLGVQAASRGSFRSASRHFDTAARYDLGDEQAVDLARRGRIHTHPLFWPILPFERFGPAASWLGAVAIMGLLAATGQDLLFAIFAGTYVLLCIYSWVVPPLARRWLSRERW
jgi:tetratricopeptide (TPR) repeat protein